MKKVMSFLLSVLAASFMATAVQADNKTVSQPKTQPKTETTQKTVEQVINNGEPFAVLRVWDLSGAKPVLKEGNKLSRTKKRALCLYVENVESKEQNLFAQYLQAPGKYNIRVDNKRMTVQADPGQGDSPKNYLMTIQLNKDEKPNACWTFDKNDPVGEYKIDLQFNDVVFKNLKFILLK